MYYIVELTRARPPGSQATVLESFLNQMAPGDDDKVFCVLTDAQKLPSERRISEAIRLSLDETEHASGVASCVLQIIQSVDPAAPIVVGSFSPWVKHVVDTLAVTQQNLRFVHLANFVADEATDTGKRKQPSDTVSEDDAVQALLICLSRARGPMRYSELPIPLVTVEPRLKRQHDRPRETFHSIPLLVQAAVKRGLVSEYTPPGEDPGNPFVHLTGTGRRVAATASAQRMPDKRGTDAEDAYGAPAIAPHLSKSEAFVTTLRSRNMGPFQEVRMAVYEEMDSLIREGTRTPSDLIRDAVAAVREKRAEVSIRSTKPYPWPRVRAFISTLARRVPVFMHGNELVHLTWVADNRAVDALKPDWKLAFDGELICFLLSCNHEIFYHDVPELAGALYNSRSDESFDRVVSVVSYLTSSGRVTSAPDGSLRLVTSEAES